MIWNEKCDKLLDRLAERNNRPVWCYSCYEPGPKYSYTACAYYECNICGEDFAIDKSYHRCSIDSEAKRYYDRCEHGMKHLKESGLLALM